MKANQNSAQAESDGCPSRLAQKRRMPVAAGGSKATTPHKKRLKAALNTAKSEFPSLIVRCGAPFVLPAGALCTHARGPKLPSTPSRRCNNRARAAFSSFVNASTRAVDVYFSISRSGFNWFLRGNLMAPELLQIILPRWNAGFACLFLH